MSDAADSSNICCVLCPHTSVLAVLSLQWLGEDDRPQDEENAGVRLLTTLTLVGIALFSFLFFALTRCRDHEYGVSDDDEDIISDNSGVFRSMDDRQTRAGVAGRSSGGIFS